MSLQAAIPARIQTDMPARILIITNGHLSRNPRPHKEALALGNAGFDVTVLSVRNHRSSGLQDAALARGAPFKRVEIDLLGGRGWSRWPALFRRALQRAARDLAHAGGPCTLPSLGPAGSLLRRARALPSDLVIVHNEVPHWVGLKLIGDGRRVAADIEDWHSEDLLPEDRRHRPLPLIRSVERGLLHRAVYTSTTSEALADALAGRYGGTRPRVITNAFALQPDPHRGPPGDPPSFFWFSQRLGPGRGLEPFLAAWAAMSRPSRVVLLGEPAGGYEERLRQAVPPALRDAISFLPLVPPSELPSVIALHDIGLALEEVAIVNRNLTITNKILQYLNAGLAVVASSTAGQREVLRHSPDAGLVVELNDAPSLSAVLDRLVADRAALAGSQAAARRLAEDRYCWEIEAPRLVDLVTQATARR